jgi:hypothetical protein
MPTLTGMRTAVLAEPEAAPPTAKAAWEAWAATVKAA